MNLRTLIEFVRLLATVAMAVRAGILLHRTIAEEVDSKLQEEVDPANYPPGSLGDAIQSMSRSLAQQMAMAHKMAGDRPEAH